MPSSSATRRTDKSRAPERFKLPKVFLAIIVKHREFKMDWNRVEGNWKQMKGKVKEKWGNLTDDDLTAINGQRDQLEGKIQERYGLAKDIFFGFFGLPGTRFSAIQNSHPERGKGTLETV